MSKQDIISYCIFADNLQVESANRITINIIYQMSRTFNRGLISIVLLVGLFFATLSQQPYKKVVHNTDPNAKCLDGSSPALYVHQGTDKNSFLIFFNGGGSCGGDSMSEVLQNCYQRSKTNLGSSKNLSDTLNGPGYLSTDPSNNKFATWTKIFINYCDGSFHQGSNKDAIKYKDAELYFRGADNVRSHFKWLLANHNFENAQKVLLTGTSAGAIATFIWSGYVKSLLANPQALSLVVDSGVFMNFASPQTGLLNMERHFINLFKVANINEKSPLSLCNRLLTGQQYKCLILQYSWTLVEGRILLINSEYDSYAIKDLLDIHCLKNGASGQTLSGCSQSEIANIESYRKAYKNFISLFSQTSRTSVWSIACSNHVYTVYNDFYDVAAQRVPKETGETVKTAVERFVLNNEKVTSIDAEAWPNNSPCAN